MRAAGSIHWRLLSGQLVLLIAVLGILLVSHYKLRESQIFESIDEELQNAVIYGMPAIFPPREGNRPGSSQLSESTWGRPKESPFFAPERRPRSEISSAGPELGEELYVLVWNEIGEHLKSYGVAPNALKVEPVRVRSGEMVFRTHGETRELIVSHPSKATVLFGRRIQQEIGELALLRFQLVGVGFAVLFLGFLIGTLSIRFALQPVQKISEAARKLIRGAHGARIDPANVPREMVSLSETLNEAFDSLEMAIEKQKRFSADASHELRTPIAIILAQTQSILRNERTSDQYQDALRACQRAAKRMELLTEGLLELARIESVGESGKFKRVQVNDLIAEAIESQEPLPDSHQVVFEPLHEPCRVSCNGMQLSQAISTIIGNAIVHNPQGCTVTLSARLAGSYCSITIVDDGVGIEEGEAAKIFERFYRVDRARSRERGGAGLGLAIARSLVVANNGRIDYTRAESGGAAFQIDLQLAQ